MPTLAPHCPSVVTTRDGDGEPAVDKLLCAKAVMENSGNDVTTVRYFMVEDQDRMRETSQRKEGEKE